MKTSENLRRIWGIRAIFAMKMRKVGPVSKWRQTRTLQVANMASRSRRLTSPELVSRVFTMANLRKKLSLKVRHEANAHRIGLTRNSFIRPENGARIVCYNCFWQLLFHFGGFLTMYYTLLSSTSNCISDP